MIVCSIQGYFVCFTLGRETTLNLCPEACEHERSVGFSPWRMRCVSAKRRGVLPVSSVVTTSCWNLAGQLLHSPDRHWEQKTRFIGALST